MCNLALRSLVFYSNNRRSRRRLSFLRHLYHFWKHFVERKVLRRQGFILRIQQILHRSRLAHVLFCLKLNYIMAVARKQASRVLLKASFKTWGNRFLKRSLLRRSVAVLEKGWSYQMLRLHWHFWKVSVGPGMHFQALFFYSVVFRRWRGLFVFSRHYRMKLLGDVVDEWSRLVFGRLHARLHARRGRRIAARLMTRYSQHRCALMRSYFNRWAANVDVLLPAQRLEAGLAKGRLNVRSTMKHLPDTHKPVILFLILERMTRI